MIFDHQSAFSIEQAITATADSENSLDLAGLVGTPPHAAAALAYDIGNADNRITLMVDETFTAAGAATLTISLEIDDNSAFSSATTLWTSPAIGKATLVEGYIIPDLYILPRKMTERYAQLVYTVGTGPFTAGKLTAGFAHGEQTNV